MTEIKSTLDLVMEKLKDLKVTEEEKRQFKQQEEKERAQRLFHRFFEGKARDWDFLKEEVAKLSEAAKEELLRMISEGLPLEDGLSERYTKGLEVLFGEEVRKGVQQLLEAYQKRRDDRIVQFKKELREALARRGIKGTAVDPNPKLHPRWREGMEELQQEFRAELLDLLKGA